MLMKRLAGVVAAAVVLSGWMQTGAAAAEEAFARITAIHIEKTNVVVEVEASGSLAKITLESSTRVGRRAWEPRAVEVLKGTEAGPINFTFTVPISPAIEIL